MKGVFRSEVVCWVNNLALPRMLYAHPRAIYMDVSCDRCGYTETYKIAFPGERVQLVGRRLPNEEGKQREKADCPFDVSCVWHPSNR